MPVINRIGEFEKDLCLILASLANHIHPKIANKIKQRNREEMPYFRELFADRINLEHYFFEGSACVFPGVRRRVSADGAINKYHKKYKALMDDNRFPRHLWCFLLNGKCYNGPNWKNSGLGAYELAHIFSHKDSELSLEREFFDYLDEELSPNGDFTCACNIVLLPKGTVRPTDNSRVIKAAFYGRYIELYGEESLNGRRGFRNSALPNWYEELVWNEPRLPVNWEENIDKLLAYRTDRITHLLKEIAE